MPLWLHIQRRGNQCFRQFASLKAQVLKGVCWGFEAVLQHNILSSYTYIGMWEDVKFTKDAIT
jgi:hypothetical protein